jgi:uncharacterized DUF497 family protein
LKDDVAITIFEEHPKEDRYITIGMDAKTQILVVVYTFDDLKNFPELLEKHRQEKQKN